jgi:hypothetical protein
MKNLKRNSKNGSKKRQKSIEISKHSNTKERRRENKHVQTSHTQQKPFFQHRKQSYTNHRHYKNNLKLLQKQAPDAYFTTERNNRTSFDPNFINIRTDISGIKSKFYKLRRIRSKLLTCVDTLTI